METTRAADRFEELLAHRAWVRRVARGLFLDENRADDLEQEVWLDALRADAPRSPRSWLGTVLRRVAASLRRSQGRRASHELRAPVRAPAPDPSDLVARAEVVERVARAVRTLEEPSRTVILLRYFEDLSPPDIAARLGVPVETVRTRLRRGLARLRSRLDAESGGERRRWMLPLIPLARRPAPAAGGSGLAAGVAGAIAMTVKAKVVVVSAVVLLLAGALALLPEPASDRGPPVPSREVEPIGVESVPDPEPPPAGETAAEATAPVRNPDPGSGSAAIVVGRILDDETGRPVPGAKVSLVNDSLRRTGEPAAVTDSDGCFRIAGSSMERAGNDLLVVASGYAEAVRSVYGWRDRAAGGDPADLGDIRLERGAVVSGRVLAADGPPVAGARILFLRNAPAGLPGSFGPNFAREVATSDALGRFSLAPIAPASAGFHHILFAVAEDRLGWLPLAPVAGRKELVDQDIRLAPTGGIEVTVRGPDDRPVPGATVTAKPHFVPLGPDRYAAPRLGMGVKDPILRAVFTGRTDDSGRLLLSRLPVDEDRPVYDVVAQAAGMSPGWKKGVRVAPGGSVPVTVQLGRDPKMVLSGTVRNDAGEPVAGAEVNFFGHRTRTDESGAYRIENVTPPQGYDPWVTVDAEGYAKLFRVFRRTDRWNEGDLDLVLDRADPVRGIVVNEEGQPLAGARITLGVGGIGVAIVHSGADGRFELQAPAGREAVLSLSPPPPLTDWEAHGVVAVPADGSEIRIVLRKALPGARLLVEVRDAETGSPLDPVHADLLPADWRAGFPAGYRSLARIESGRAVFDRVPPGDWILWIGAPDRAPVRTEVRIEEGASEKTITVRCPLPGTVRGRLEGGPPLQRRGMVFLSLVGDSKPQWVRLQSDPGLIDAAHVETDGTFMIEGVPPGRLRIRAATPGFGGETEVEVRGGEEVEAILRLEATGRATFRAAALPLLPVLEVRYAAPGRNWSSWIRILGRGGGLPEWTTNVPLGPVRWEARSRDRGVQEGAPLTVASGEFIATAGETVVVTVPVR